MTFWTVHLLTMVLMITIHHYSSGTESQFCAELIAVSIYRVAFNEGWGTGLQAVWAAK